MDNIKLIECPRDAMQGISKFIETEDKIRYINSLLEVGFHTIDVGSFVSPRMIPQMKDTAEVLERINWQNSNSKLLTIVGNPNGAFRASQYSQVEYIGYPCSLSETFQKRNTNATIAESLIRLKEIQSVCLEHEKTLVVYLSMCFGNPYGDFWSSDLVAEWTFRIIQDFGAKIVSLSDTIGVADATLIQEVFQKVRPFSKNIEIGVHLHAKPDDWEDKIAAALDNGCTRLDGAISGFGGCPYASDSMTGNIPTERLVSYLGKLGIPVNINRDKLDQSVRLSNEIFN